MKFVHIADLHLDSPFTNLSEKGNLGNIRRLEQRNAIKKVIGYCKENNVDYLFIAGDLYEENYIRKTSIDYINSLFKEIPETKIFITPGNHDPYIKNSIYETYNFAENVHIFKKSIIEKYEDENVNIYGSAFTDFYEQESPIDNLQHIELNGKTNFLIMHCDLNGAKDKDGFSYNAVLESNLANLKFDYCALGHIHKNNFENGRRIIYPGSLISLGFDELGEHGMVVGELANGELSTKFVPVDERKFQELEVKIDEFNTQEELVEYINNLALEEKVMYKIILVGNRNFEINTYDILKLLNQNNVLKVKDKTKIGYDIEKLSKENSLRGIYIKKLLEKSENGEYSQEEIEKAIELGLEVM